jgi:tetratricopeptide (TPR) repeat protein
MDPSYKSLTVLVVDDVFNVRAMLKNMLRQLGFGTLLEASSGEKAVELLTQEVVDLVLCDWNMPGMKGVDVLRFVRKQAENATLPFIMVTGEINEAVVAEAAETEVDAYLVKPFTMQSLGQRVASVLSQHREVSEIDRHLAQGRAYITTKQFDKASAEFKAALKINPKSPRTLLEIGKIYEEQGNDVQAREFYHRAVKVQPKFLKGHEALAGIYKALGDRESHLEHLDQAVKISPRNLERRFMLGQAHLESGNSEEARKILGDILEEATKQYSSIAERVGEALLNMGAYEVAEQAFSKALEANPNNLHLFNQLGIAFRRQGKFDEAVSNYMRALKLAPKDENLLYNLGRAYYDGGRFDEAIKILQRALKLNPEFQEARELMTAAADKA